ncbi:MAG TPA: hypothetical protein VF855_08280 [Acidimicrobiales bacterium]
MPDPAGACTLVLPDGGALVVRTATEADLASVIRLYDGLSVEDRHRRFFSAARPSDGFLRVWLAADQHGGHSTVVQHLSAGAEGGDADAPVVAEAGFLPLPTGGAEFAITVAREWRGWLGPYLLDRLTRVAAARGLTSLEAQVLLENQPMLSGVRARGYATYDHTEYDVVHVISGTGERTPHWPDRHGQPRVLVEIPGARWHATAAVRNDHMHVVACPGPREGKGGECPALAGRPCPLAAAADAVVVALRPSDPRVAELVDAHRRLHPDVPLVIVQPVKGEGLGMPEGACSLAANAPSGEILHVLHDLLGDYWPGRSEPPS